MTFHHRHDHQPVGEALVLHQGEGQRIAPVAVELGDLVHLLHQLAQADFLAGQRAQQRRYLFEGHGVHAGHVEVARHDALGQPGLQRQLLWRGSLHHGGRLVGRRGSFHRRQRIHRVAAQRAVGVGGACGQRAGQQYV